MNPAATVDDPLIRKIAADLSDRPGYCASTAPGSALPMSARSSREHPPTATGERLIPRPERQAPRSVPLLWPCTVDGRSAPVESCLQHTDEQVYGPGSLAAGTGVRPARPEVRGRHGR